MPSSEGGNGIEDERKSGAMDEEEDKSSRLRWVTQKCELQRRSKVRVGALGDGDALYLPPSYLYVGQSALSQQGCPLVGD